MMMVLGRTIFCMACGMALEEARPKLVPAPAPASESEAICDLAIFFFKREDRSSRELLWNIRQDMGIIRGSKRLN